MTTTSPFVITTPKLNPREGQYEIGGRRYARVTTILGVISKPALWEWRMKVGVLEAMRISQAAADLGTEIHAVCEGIARGDAVRRWPARFRLYATAYFDWLAEDVREVLATERVVVNERRGYAGQVDAIVRLRDGRKAVVDIKTGKSLDGTYRLQLSAYAAALAAMGEPVDLRLVVHLPSSNPGTLRAVEYDDDDDDRRAWLAALRLWQWNERHKHDWKANR